MDGYLTVAGEGEAEVVIGKSRFIGHAAPAQTQEAALAYLHAMRARYKDASHNCFAYIVGRNAGIQRYGDDGEPGGTAGLPIMHVLQSRGVVDLAVVVTRYFGGVLLGTGGLVRAYTQGAVIALEAARVVQMHKSHTYMVLTSYERWGKLSHALGAQPISIASTEYGADIVTTVQVRARDVAALLACIATATDGQAEALFVQEAYAPWPDQEKA